MSPTTRPRTATLRISCPDRKGLVAAVAQSLYTRGVNILDSDQHTDPQAGVFFQRLRLDLEELRGTDEELRAEIVDIAGRFDMRWQISAGERPHRMAILVSKYEHCLHDLLLRHRAGELRCEIPLVISNHPDLEPVVRGYGVEFHHQPIDPENKAAQMREMAERIDAAGADLVVLARYMQVLTPELCERYAGRAINIHHSFLPAFAGGRPYHQAYRRGVKLIGATAHYATVDLDEGPIIEQDVIRVSHRDTPSDLVRKGRDLERLVLARAVRHHLEDRILVYDNKTVVFD